MRFDVIVVFHREKNFEKAQKEAKVKARKEAARHAELADNVTDDDLAAVEDTFLKEAGLDEAGGLRVLAERRATAAVRGARDHEQQGPHADAAAGVVEVAA